MSEVIAQLAPVLAYIVATFVLYRLLVKSKEAQIDTLKEQVGLLKEQLAAAKEQSAENLLLRLQNLAAASASEIERASSDHKTTATELEAKQAEADNLRQQVANLVDLLNNPPLAIFPLFNKTPLPLRDADRSRS